MAIIEVKGLIKNIMPYNKDKGKIVFTITENAHIPSATGEMQPSATEYNIAVEANEEEMTKYQKALDKKGLLVITGELRVMFKNATIWILAKFENVYFV